MQNWRARGSEARLLGDRAWSGGGAKGMKRAAEPGRSCPLSASSFTAWVARSGMRLWEYAQVEHAEDAGVNG